MRADCRQSRPEMTMDTADPVRLLPERPLPPYAYLEGKSLTNDARHHPISKRRRYHRSQQHRVMTGDCSGPCHGTSSKTQSSGCLPSASPSPVGENIILGPVRSIGSTGAEKSSGYVRDGAIDCRKQHQSLYSISSAVLCAVERDIGILQQRLERHLGVRACHSGTERGAHG